MSANITISGRIYSDIEETVLKSEKKKLSFNFGVLKHKQSDLELENPLIFMRVTIWNERLAERLQEANIQKKQQLVVVGELKFRAYRNANGEIVDTMEIDANDVFVLNDSSTSSGSNPASPPKGKALVEAGSGKKSKKEDEFDPFADE